MSFYPFRVTDSAYYILIKNEFSSNELEANLKQILPILEKEKKIRIIFDKPLEIKKVSREFHDFFLKNNLNKKIGPYQTTFYGINNFELDNLIQLYPKSNWKNYLNFNYQEVTSEEEKEICLQLLLDSFGVCFSKEECLKQKEFTYKKTFNLVKREKIKKYLEEVLAQENLKMFLVRSKAGQIVGTFCLVKIEQEIQIQSVAGWMEDGKYKLYSGSKLPILVAACLDIFAKSKLDLISLSSSKPKLASKYQSLGFKSIRDRKGILVTL